MVLTTRLVSVRRRRGGVGQAQDPTRLRVVARWCRRGLERIRGSAWGADRDLGSARRVSVDRDATSGRWDVADQPLRTAWGLVCMPLALFPDGAESPPGSSAWELWAVLGDSDSAPVGRASHGRLRTGPRCAEGRGAASATWARDLDLQ